MTTPHDRYLEPKENYENDIEIDESDAELWFDNQNEEKTQELELHFIDSHTKQFYKWLSQKYYTEIATAQQKERFEE